MDVRILCADAHGFPKPGTRGRAKSQDEDLEAAALVQPDQVGGLLKELRLSAPRGRFAGNCHEHGVMELDMVAFDPRLSELMP
ncbi:MAG: hypothetical protein ACK4YM_09200 [Novosphingobium sp.]